MKPTQPNSPGQPILKLQKVKNKRYYLKVPGLKVPVVLSEYLFKKWKGSNQLD